jgi:hypothetical protein
MEQMKSKQDYKGEWLKRQENPLDFMTENELALALKQRGIRAGKRTLRDWRQRRTGPPFTYLGATPIYPRAAFADWLSASTHQPHHSA